jgi:hypothetical protein
MKKSRSVAISFTVNKEQWNALRNLIRDLVDVVEQASKRYFELYRLDVINLFITILFFLHSPLLVLAIIRKLFHIFVTTPILLLFNKSLSKSVVPPLRQVDIVC